MHKLMLLEVIGYCRRQEQAGDCPIPREFSMEQLEQAILALADHIKRIEPPLAVEKLPYESTGEGEGK